MKRRNQLPGLTVGEQMADLGTLIAAIALILVPSVWYPSLPDTIAIHFDFSGNADGWGSKASIFVLPAFGIITWAGLAILSRYPDIYNYPVKIDDENRTVQYLLARKMVKYINLLTTLLFLGITLIILLSADRNHSAGMGWLLISYLVVLTIVILRYYHNAKKYR
ncbi:MAG: hypothetical protein Kow00127_03820 [Bacteroidales bacterium]